MDLSLQSARKLDPKKDSARVVVLIQFNRKFAMNPRSLLVACETNSRSVPLCLSLIAFFNGIQGH